MLKRLLAAALAAAMSVTMLASCGSSSQSSAPGSTAPGSTAPGSTASAAGGEKKPLTIWVEKSFSDDANAAMQQRIDQFAKDTGTTVKSEFIAATDFMTKLNAAIEAKSVPDITTGASHKVLSYYPNNPYLDVTELVAEIDSTRAMFPSMKDGTKIDGKNFFVPYTSSSAMLFVRKDLFDAKGVAIPKTWNDVFEAAKKVSDPANGVYGLGMGCGPTDEDGENTFRVMMWCNGGSIWDKDGKVIAGENAQLKEMLAKYKELYDAQAIPPSAITWDPSGNNKSYLVGESAMVFNAPTLYNALKNDENNKTLFENTVVMAPPAGAAGTTLLGFSTGWSIMKDTQNAEGAKEFIRYMYDTAWYDEYMSMVCPVFAPMFPDFKDKADWKDGINAQVLSYVEDASGYYGYPVQPIQGRAIAAKNYFKFPVARMLNSVVAGGLSVDDAVKQLTDDINETAKSVG